MIVYIQMKLVLVVIIKLIHIVILYHINAIVKMDIMMMEHKFNVRNVVINVNYVKIIQIIV